MMDEPETDRTGNFQVSEAKRQDTHPGMLPPSGEKPGHRNGRQDPF